MQAELAPADIEALVTVSHAEVVAEPAVDLKVLKPPITISVSRMSKLSQKLAGMEL